MQKKTLNKSKTNPSKKSQNKNAHLIPQNNHPHQPQNTSPDWQEKDFLPLSSHPSRVRGFTLLPQPLFVRLFSNSKIEKEIKEQKIRFTRRIEN